MRLGTRDGRSIVAGIGLVLGLLGSPVPAPALTREEASCLADFIGVVRGTLPPSRELWKSPALTNEPLGKRPDKRTRARWIIEQVADPGAPLSRQIDAYLRGHEGLQSGNFWGRYFASYDKLVAFSQQYQGILRQADRYLPRGGAKILDIGAGTLNFSVYLALQSPDRRLVPVELSSAGVETGRAKLAAAGLEADVRQGSFLDPRFRNQQADGAVMNNVLYAAPDKAAALRRIYGNLKPGGTLVLSDPLAEIHDPKRMKQFLVKLADSAIDNGSPLTDFDLALTAAANLGRLSRVTGTNGGPAFSERAALEKLARGAGFTIVRSEPSYAGRAWMLVLRRPAR